MRLEIGCRMTLSAQSEIPIVLMLRPRSGLSQWVAQQRYRLDPYVPSIEYTDSYGNLCQRLMTPTGDFEVEVSAQVEAADEVSVASSAPFVAVDQLPSSTLQFLLPSRYCESDCLHNLASQVTEGAVPGYAQVESIRRWIHQSFTYQYGSSTPSTSALDIVETKVGVCRDFAHLGIALCRSLNIPARMVVGYLHGLEPMDQHAWFEAYVGDRWYTFDATQSQPKGNRVVVAYGRDAADVALITQFGPLNLEKMDVWVHACPPEL